MWMRSWWSLSLCAVAVGCGGDGGSLTAPPQTVATVTVSASGQTITVGQTLQLTADVRDAQGQPVSGQTISWTSSAPGILSVSTSGLVTAQDEGQATITATVAGKSGQVILTGSYPFPHVAGTWNVSATFDGITASTLVVNGTFVFVQASRFSGDITGVANLTARTNAEVLPVVTNYPISGTLTTTGALSLVIQDFQGSTWNFVGTVTGGTISTGRHTLMQTSNSFPGDWSATRTSTVAARTVETAPAANLEIVLRALR